MANTQNTTNSYRIKKEKPLHPLNHSRKALTIPSADKGAKQPGGGVGRKNGPVTLTRSGGILEC